MDKILVIDDKDGIRTYFRSLLQRRGYEPLMAENGVEGCELAADPEVRMIISDLRMPGELGEIELIRTLRTLRPEVPLVVITGHPSGDLLQQCEELGVKDFLAKPFELSFVTTVIERLIGPGAEKTE